MPPIYQPEVVADAVRYVVEPPEAGVVARLVGGQGDRRPEGCPGLLDRILAHRAYSGQQSDEPAAGAPKQPLHPVAGDARAHGRFDEKATAKSTELWIVKNTPMLAVAASVVVILGVGLAAAIAGGL